jgi:hypothetical protein
LVSRTLALVLAGVFAGTLVYGGVSMLVVVIQYRPQGGTPSVELALILMGLALGMTLAATAFAVGTRLGPRLARWVGGLFAVLGIGGLVYFLGASLVVSGAFPLILLTPDNIGAELWMALAAVAGIGLFQVGRAAGTPAPQTGARWLDRSWHPVALGVALGIVLAAFWSVVIYPLIPYECCLQI